MLAPSPTALNRFTGPLDLLLQLIERKELDITTVSLAAVVEDYLREVAALQEEDLERLANYLAIASRLLLIKSQALLPRRPPPEVEEDAAELLRQLEEYRRFKQVATGLKDLAEQGTRLYARQTLGAYTQSPPLQALPASHLFEALVKALARAPAAEPQEVMPLAQFPIAPQLERLQTLLSRGDVFLDDLVSQASCRQAVIALFLALLELLRLGKARVAQDGLFAPVLLRSVAAVEEGDAEQQADGSPEGVDDYVA